MQYAAINGHDFSVDCAISEYERTINVTDGENAGRSVLSGRMIRDIIGSFVSRKITFFRRGNDYASMDELWNFLLAHSVDDYVTLTCADGQNEITGQYYFTSATQKLDKVINGTNIWGEITVSFVPMDAEVRP